MFEERLKDSPTEHRHPTEHRQPAQTEKDKNKMLIFNSLKKKVTFSMENPVHVSSVCIRDPSDIE